MPNRFSDAGVAIYLAEAESGVRADAKAQLNRDSSEARFNLPPELSQRISKSWLDDARSCTHHLDFSRCGGLKCMRCGQSNVYHRPCRCMPPERQSDRIRGRRRAHPSGSLYQMP
eukprot:119935-Prymnesium_polylepis.1